MLMDSHCHLYKKYYDDIGNLMDNLEKKGISKVINNGCDFESSKEVLELSKLYDNMYCTVGLHPTEDFECLGEIVKLIKENLDNKKMIGIGEIGLDYYWNKENKEEQKDIFIKQLEVAQLYNLPVIIHTRDSTKDMLEILKMFKLKGVIHCFNGSIEVAREYIKMGYKLGINGVVTFNNCNLINVIKEIGVNDLVFETDSPYLTPVPFRGNKNDPSYINYILDYLVNNLDISREKLIEISNNNLTDIFDI